jgi:hypothetical protein
MESRLIAPDQHLIKLFASKHFKSAVEDADVEAELFYQARELIFDIRGIFKRYACV